MLSLSPTLAILYTYIVGYPKLAKKNMNLSASCCAHVPFTGVVLRAIIILKKFYYWLLNLRSSYVSFMHFVVKTKLLEV